MTHAAVAIDDPHTRIVVAGSVGAVRAAIGTR